MKINEENILNDMGEVYSLTSNPSYSKNKKYNNDATIINHLYSVTHGKFFDLPDHFNPYYDRFFWRDYDKDYIEYANLIEKYKKYYLQLSESYLKILNDNNFFYSHFNCNKTYTDQRMKEILLDFFNEEGADKYIIVKSMFDNERVSTSSVENLE